MAMPAIRFYCLHLDKTKSTVETGHAAEFFCLLGAQSFQAAWRGDSPCSVPNSLVQNSRSLEGLRSQVRNFSCKMPPFPKDKTTEVTYV
jgi:hypothetical protein